MKTEIIYGTHAVLEALKAKRRTCHTIYVLDHKNNTHIQTINQLIKNHVPIDYISKATMAQLTKTEKHQGIAARMSNYPILDETHIPSHEHAFILMLDSISDPHNMGALLRTALCTGVDAVIITKDRSVQPNAVVSKCSSGAMERIKIIQVTNLVACITLLKKQGFWISGLAKEGTQSIFSFSVHRPIVLIVGGEGKGIRPLVRKHCDHILYIPQEGPVQSLNASVAGAIAMYEVYRHTI